jgi:hypothetical protein
VTYGDIPGNGTRSVVQITALLPAPTRAAAPSRLRTTLAKFLSVGSFRWLLNGLEEGDPEVLDYLPAPRLGGEWADEPIWSNIVEDEGCKDADGERPELLDAYEYASSCAVEREIVRACRALLGLVPADLGTR